MKNEQPVSVFMCSYKRTHNLKEIIRSLEKQTNPNFRFLVWCNKYYADVKRQFKKSKLDYSIYGNTDINFGSCARFNLIKYTKGSQIILWVFFLFV